MFINEDENLRTAWQISQAMGKEFSANGMSPSFWAMHAEYQRLMNLWQR